MVSEIEGKLLDNHQVCTVVKDADKTAAYYSALNIGQIRVNNYSFTGTLHGEPSEMSLRIGMTGLGSTQMQIIQPLANAVFHALALSNRGEGGHHMGIYVSDLASAVEKWAKLGVKPIYRGKISALGVELACMDTARIGGVYFEFIQMPSTLAPLVEEAPESRMNLSRLSHVGVVVKDAEATADFYSRLGFGSFTPVPATEVGDLSVAGISGKTSFWVKGANFENCRLPIEIIQPLGSGTIFHEALDRGGEGVHHVGCWVSSMAEELARFQSLGVEPLMSNEHFVHLDTREVGGLIMELKDRPNV